MPHDSFRTGTVLYALSCEETCATNGAMFRNAMIHTPRCYLVWPRASMLIQDGVSYLALQPLSGFAKAEQMF